MRSLIEAVPVPVFLVDSEKKIKATNKAFYEKFNCISSEITGHSLFDFCHDPLNKPILMNALDKSIYEGLDFFDLEIEFDFFKKGREKILMSSKKTELLGPEKKAAILSLQAIPKSQTEELRTLVDHEKMLREIAENSNRKKDEFLATLSHELRTPLTTILGWAQELRSKMDDPKGLEEGLSMIERNAQVQGQLINDLLDVSRINSGKLSLSPKIIDLIHVLKITIDSVTSLAKNKSLLIETFDLPKKCLVYADPTRMQQVFWNLFTNAIKFTPEGGKIVVEGSLKDSPNERLVQIAIRDTGIGIKKEFIPLIFQRFVQEDVSTAKKYGGIGLGLAIVKTLLETQSGTIIAESQGPGTGATFTLTLPLIPESETQTGLFMEGADLQKKPRRLDGLKILAVDDNEDNRILIASILKSLGAEVQVADSAVSGLQVLSKFHPDILLTDISMPGEDGYSFLRKINKLDSECTKSLPIVALTAFAAPEDVTRMLKAGFSAHIAKPIERLALSSTILKLVNPG